MNLKKTLIFGVVRLTGFIRQRLMRQDFAYKLLFIEQLSGFRTLLGKWKAWYCFEKAQQQCPAYKSFLETNPGTVRLNGWVPDFSQVPPMDKPTYIKAYTMAERCHGGVIPTRGAVIDTSSGSTGKPTAWVRGRDEREAVARVMQIALRQLIPDKQILFLNAFALGPWATGMSVSHAVSDECLLVSVGPDVDKIVELMNDFGPDKFKYVIAGYPPFLKMLVDSPAVNWKSFDAIGFYGGEGMSEAMRTYLMGAFGAVYGDYGASDLEINIGAENDFTVGLRRLMAANPELRHRLNSRLSNLPGLERLVDGLPHVFQYNQLDYVVETNGEGELLITLCRASNVAPKIRYNIHDNGFVMPYHELLAILKDEGVDIADLPPVIASLPLMFHYGRSDLAVSYYGCKIPPAAIEKIFFELSEMAKIFNSFRLITKEDDNHDKHLTLAVELSRGVEPPSADDSERLQGLIFAALARDSQDYRESSRIALQRRVTPSLAFHRFREGPFVGSDIRMKAKYTEEK
ncbi:phenylacetate--CoA ligase family protein [soil metagenome]